MTQFNSPGRPEQTAEWNEVKFLQVSFLFSTRRTSCQPCERSVGVQLKIPRTERRSHAAHAREAISISGRGHIHIHITRNVFDTAEHTCSLSLSQSAFSDFSVRSRFCLGLILLTVSAVDFSWCSTSLVVFLARARKNSFSCFIILHPVAQKRDISATGTQHLCSKHMNIFSRCFPSRQLSFPLPKEKYTVYILGCVLSRFEVLRTRFCRCALVACRSKYI